MTEQSNTQEAISALEQGMRVYRALESAHSALTALQNLEDSVTTQTANLNKLLSDIESANVELEIKNASVEEVKQEAVRILDAARSDAAVLMSNSENEMNAAKETAQVLLNDTFERRNMLHNEIAELEVSKASLESECNELSAKLNALKAEAQKLVG